MCLPFGSRFHKFWLSDGGIIAGEGANLRKLGVFLTNEGRKTPTNLAKLVYCRWGQNLVSEIQNFEVQQTNSCAFFF